MSQLKLFLQQIYKATQDYEISTEYGGVVDANCSGSN